VVAAGVALVTIGGLLLSSPSGCTPRVPRESQTLSDQTMRVRICPAVEQVLMSGSQPPVYFTAADPTPRQLDLPHNVAVPVRYTAEGWLVSGTRLGKGVLYLQPTVAGSIAFDEKTYRGQFRLVPLGGNAFDVINDVNIDDYLKGVLAEELYLNWHDQTYQAQAIVARTYALYEKFTPRQTRAWDVWANTNSQVYGGMKAETARSRSAVEATSGIVVAYGPPGQEKIFKAYFSSCCGGITQSAMHAFGEPYTPALSEQYVGSLCSISMRYTWPPVVVGKKELTRRFGQWGRNRGRPEQGMAEVRGIEIEQRNRFGRPVRFTVTDAKGTRYSWMAEELRWAVNTQAPAGTTLNSSFVENIINDADSIRFLGGHGLGHGVGMCQWCAQARAMTGMRHEDIVTAAYPGAKLKRAY
jgi:stage II sporulation protein D